MRDPQVSEKNIPHIDLCNFEEPQFHTCRYILTSPRSLKACARLKIKPLELISKSREEFNSMYKNLPQKKVEELYKQYENTRKEKLMKLRLVREELMKDTSKTEGGNSYDHIGKPVSKTVRGRNLSARTISLKPDITQKPEPRSQSAQQTLPERYKDLLAKLPPSEVKRLKLAHQRCLQQTAPALRTRSDERTTGSFIHKHKIDKPVPTYKNAKKTIGVHDSTTGDGPSSGYSNSSSVTRERQIWSRKHERESDESERFKKCLERQEQNSQKAQEQNELERQRSLRSAHEERERRLKQAQERRRELDRMLEAYRRELYEAQEVTQNKARERVSMRASEEQLKRIHDRIQREEHIKENNKLIQQRQEEWRKAAETLQKQKQEHVEKFLEEREARIQQSRMLAKASEELREEMQRVYNLDSFDKKAQRVNLVNELGLGSSV